MLLDGSKVGFVVVEAWFLLLRIYEILGYILGGSVKGWGC